MVLIVILHIYIKQVFLAKRFLYTVHPRLFACGATVDVVHQEFRMRTDEKERQFALRFYLKKA